MCHLLLALPLLALPLFWIFPMSVALPAYSATAGLSAMIYWYAMQAMTRPRQNGAEGMVGEIGVVMKTSDGDLRVRVHNELWHAVSPGIELHKGDYLEVVGVEQFTLRVQKLELYARYFGRLPRPPSVAELK
jgi:membrane protein implicated in regulation of membrane protease activity